MQPTTRCESQAGFLGMDETPAADKECCVDNENLSFSIKKDFSLVDDSQFVFSASKINIAFEGVEHDHFEDEDLQLGKANAELAQELCLINRWGRQFRIPYSSLVSLHENLQQHHLGHIELKPPDSLRIICRALPAINIPLNVSASKRESLSEKLKFHKRRTKSTSDLNKFFFECKSSSAPGKVTLNPLGQWIVDAVEGKDTVRNLLQSHIISLANDTNLRKAQGDGFAGPRCSELVVSPSVQRSSLLKKPSIVRRRCGSEVPGKMATSSSSRESHCSCSSCVVASKAVLCCSWKNGIHHLEFSVDDRGEAYEATSFKLEFSSDKYPSYVYLFHDRSNGLNDQKGFRSDVVGRMKVSSCLTLDSRNHKVVETEFTLVGSSILADQLHHNNIVSRNHKFVPKKMVDVFKMNTSHLPLIGSKFRKHSPVSQPGFSGELNELGRELFINDCFLPNFELAAVIVRDPVSDKTEEASVGGWGLKFLEKARVPYIDKDSPTKGQSVMAMNLVIPAGFHGGPLTAGEGPSSLIKRWRTEGQCDCGGWDTGCPLTVMNNNSPITVDSSAQTDLQDDSSFELFKEGSREGEPSLRIVNVRQGLYIIHFHSTLSALQAFSAAVALIHTRNQDLFRTMYRS